MSDAYLVSLSIGPVQDFIAAALRTRDLWFGSNMLSEVSKAAAKAMLDKQAELIFPAVTTINDLVPFSSLSVANRVVAEFTGNDVSVKQLMNDAKTAACERLDDLIYQAKQNYELKIPDVSLRTEIWDEQANSQDLLELYATWVKVSDDHYLDARKKLDRLNAARKNSREFLQPEINPRGKGYGLPKSSLDGRRETVLPNFPEEQNRHYRRILRMGDGEQLDLMGLVKRLAGGKVDQFTPTTRIAIDSWISAIAETEQGKNSLQAIGTELNNFLNSGLVTRVKGNQSIYADMPFDSALLYKDRLDTALKDCGTGKLDHQYENNLRDLRNILQPLWKKYGHPGPYYVLMLADGDFMGALLDKATTKLHHQRISALLTEFAQAVPQMARDNKGHCIYAGGDDVLVMVPLHTAIQLADELRQFFYETLKEIAEKLGADQSPTLSVGLVLTHMQAPLGRVRKQAALAEQLAKGNETTNPRNALGVIVAPRSGAELQLRLRWDTESLNHFGTLVSLYREGELSTRFGYELREVETLLNGMDLATAEKIKQLELKRILGRKNTSGGEQPITDETRNAVVQHAVNIDFDEVFNQHLIARWLGAH